MDLTKPLIPKYSIEGQTYTIEYEGMNMLCLHCGRFGHIKATCGEYLNRQKGKEGSETREKEAGKDDMEEREKVGDTEESQWKVVQKP